MKSKKRKRQVEAKRDRKRAMMDHAFGNSVYARKSIYLFKTGQWGFDVPHPKPWK